MKKALISFAVIILIMTACSSNQKIKNKNSSKSLVNFENICFLVPSNVSTIDEENSNQNLVISIKKQTISDLNKKNKTNLMNKLRLLSEKDGELTKEGILRLYKSGEIFVFHNEIPMGGIQKKQYQVVTLNDNKIGDSFLGGIINEGKELSTPAYFETLFLIDETIFDIRLSMKTAKKDQNEDLSKIENLIDKQATDNSDFIIINDFESKDAFANLVWTGDKSIPQRFYDLYSAWEEIKNSIQLADGTKIEFK